MLRRGQSLLPKLAAFSSGQSTIAAQKTLESLLKLDSEPLSSSQPCHALGFNQKGEIRAAWRRLADRFDALRKIVLQQMSTGGLRPRRSLRKLCRYAIDSAYRFGDLSRTELRKTLLAGYSTQIIPAEDGLPPTVSAIKNPTPAIQ